MKTKDFHSKGRTWASESKATAAQNPTATGDGLPRLAFSMRETGKILGVSYITVFRLLKRGKLRACGDLRTKLIPRAEIDRYLRESIATS